MIRPWLSKEQFMEKYAKSDSTYRTRMTEFKNIPAFKDGFIQPTSSEVWIDEAIYQDYLIWKHRNRFKTKGAD